MEYTRTSLQGLGTAHGVKNAHYWKDKGESCIILPEIWKDNYSWLGWGQGSGIFLVGSPMQDPAGSLNYHCEPAASLKAWLLVER